MPVPVARCALYTATGTVYNAQLKLSEQGLSEKVLFISSKSHCACADVSVGPDYIFISQNDTAYESAINAHGRADFVCAVSLLPWGAVEPPLLKVT